MAPLIAENQKVNEDEVTESSCKCGMSQAHAHLAILRLEGRLMRQIFQAYDRDHWVPVEAGLPSDAQLMSAEYDVACRRYNLVFQSSQFPAVPEGATIGTEISLDRKEKPWAPRGR